MPKKASRADLFDRVAAEFKSKSFMPPRALTQADLQTLGAYFWPGRFRSRDLTADEERLFDVDAETKVLARCRWQENATDHATLVMWHGIEGSTSSAYMLAASHKGFAAGFNVVRVNIRNCGGTEHLTPTLYHGGMSNDARAVIRELIEHDRLKQIFAIGFSLGGNTVLKMAGEMGEDHPQELCGVVAISPSISLGATSDLLMARRNFIYHREFLYSLKRRIRGKEKLFPGRYDCSSLRRIKTLREFDDTYVAREFGFRGADDYYAKASSLPFIKDIRVPTLIVHAQDDPFVPFAPVRQIMKGHQEPVPEVSPGKNSNVIVIAPERGGHVAFLSAETDHEDRFWAENRLMDFCRIVLSR